MACTAVQPTDPFGIFLVIALPCHVLCHVGSPVRHAMLQARARLPTSSTVAHQVGDILTPPTLGSPQMVADLLDLHGIVRALPSPELSQLVLLPLYLHEEGLQLCKLNVVLLPLDVLQLLRLECGQSLWDV